MNFNRGFYCEDHGPMEKSGTRNKRNICLICSKDVSVWERPIEERAGRCSLCGCGGFKQGLFKGDLLIQCHDCRQVYNTDKNNIVVSVGKIENIEKNRIEREKKNQEIRRQVEGKGETK